MEQDVIRTTSRCSTARRKGYIARRGTVLATRGRRRARGSPAERYRTKRSSALLRRQEPRLWWSGIDALILTTEEGRRLGCATASTELRELEQVGFGQASTKPEPVLDRDRRRTKVRGRRDRRRVPERPRRPDVEARAEQPDRKERGTRACRWLRRQAAPSSEPRVKLADHGRPGAMAEEARVLPKRYN